MAFTRPKPTTKFKMEWVNQDIWLTNIVQVSHKLVVRDCLGEIGLGYKLLCLIVQIWLDKVAKNHIDQDSLQDKEKEEEEWKGNREIN